MELRTVNPKALRENPDNPRPKTKPDHADEQMRLSVAAVGILQPPVVREMPEGLTIRYGSRRVRAARALKLPQIEVLVLGEDERADDDAMRAMLENVVRKAMTPVDQWRAIEKLVSERWTEEAIANVLALPLRTIRKLRLLARLHPPMLDAIAAGSMPNEHQLRAVAAASAEEQAQAWKAHKPKRDQDVAWHDLARALEKRRIPFSAARFDAATAASYGVRWQEDLFAPAGEDAKYTTDVEAFMSAQAEWLAANLPPEGRLLPLDRYGDPELPRGAEEVYGKPQEGDLVAYYLDTNGSVRTQAYRPKEAWTAPAAPDGGIGGIGASGSHDGEDDQPARVRPEVRQKGLAMIGDLRTDALHRALQEHDIPDQALIGLLVLALSGSNVSVQAGRADAHIVRGKIAQSVSEGAMLTTDPDTVRAAARAMLAAVLSCRDNMTDSGAAARIAGESIGASTLLPNMATEEFLACLSKPGLERVAREQGVRVESTGKLTRANFLAHFREGTFVHPAALFRLTEEDARKDAERRRCVAGLYGYGERDGQGADEAGPEDLDPALQGDDAVRFEPGRHADDEEVFERPPEPDNDAGRPDVAAE